MALCQAQLALIIPCPRCHHLHAQQLTAAPTANGHLGAGHSECSLLAIDSDGRQELREMDDMVGMTPSSTFDSFDIPNYARLAVPVTSKKAKMVASRCTQQRGTQTSHPSTPLRMARFVLFCHSSCSGRQSQSFRRS